MYRVPTGNEKITEGVCRLVCPTCALRQCACGDRRLLFDPYLNPDAVIVDGDFLQGHFFEHGFGLL